MKILERVEMIAECRSGCQPSIDPGCDIFLLEVNDLPTITDKGLHGGVRILTIRRKIYQDRRKSSRLQTRLDCQFDSGGALYNAVIIDISLKGAFFSSGFLPPANSAVTVAIDSAHLGRPLILEGKVKRSIHGMSGPGSSGRFGIEFSSSPLDLTKLVSKLLSSKSAY